MDVIGNRTIGDIWRDQADATPDHPFLIYESDDGSIESYSYREFERHIHRTARTLREEYDIMRGDKVAIHLRNSPEYLQIWFALLTLGAVTVHSNVTHSIREVTYTVETADSTLLVTEPQYLDDVLEAARRCDNPEVVLVRDGETDRADIRSLAEDSADSSSERVTANLESEVTAQILFTSGTTSDPKGVVLTHANLLFAGERQTKHLLLRSDDRNATALPLYHVNAQTSALASLTAGATFVLFERYRTGAIMDQLQRHAATVTSLIGTQVRAMLKQDVADQNNDLRVITFAINVDDEQKERFETAIDTQLLNGYGLSEAMSLVTQAPIHTERRWPSIGLPVVDRTVCLLDNDGNPVPVGEVGEIAIDGERGRNIFKKYYGLPERTENAFTDDGLFLTGDYGRFDRHGYLYFVDRKKNIIETRGENVSESEVEGVLASHDAVEEAVVIGIPHDVYGEVVKAFIKPRKGIDVTEVALLDHAADRLAEFKIPESIEFVTELPRTSIGKIEKKALRDR